MRLTATLTKNEVKLVSGQLTSLISNLRSSEPVSWLVCPPGKWESLLASCSSIVQFNLNDGEETTIPFLGFLLWSSDHVLVYSITIKIIILLRMSSYDGPTNLLALHTVDNKLNVLFFRRKIFFAFWIDPMENLNGGNKTEFIMFEILNKLSLEDCIDFVKQIYNDTYFCRASHPWCWFYNDLSSSTQSHTEHWSLQPGCYKKYM